MKVRTVEACRIAGLDRARLNEAISRGNYQFPPPNIVGEGRLWDEWDILQLHIYARLLDCGLQQLNAATLASLFRQGAQQDFENGIPHDINKEIMHYFATKIYRSFTMGDTPIDFIRVLTGVSRKPADE